MKRREYSHADEAEEKVKTAMNKTRNGDDVRM